MNSRELLAHERIKWLWTAEQKIVETDKGEVMFAIDLGKEDEEVTKIRAEQVMVVINTTLKALKDVEEKRKK